MSYCRLLILGLLAGLAPAAATAQEPDAAPRGIGVAVTPVFALASNLLDRGSDASVGAKLEVFRDAPLALTFDATLSRVVGEYCLEPLSGGSSSSCGLTAVSGAVGARYTFDPGATPGVLPYLGAGAGLSRRDNGRRSYLGSVQAGVDVRLGGYFALRLEAKYRPTLEEGHVSRTETRLQTSHWWVWTAGLRIDSRR